MASPSFGSLITQTTNILSKHWMTWLAGAAGMAVILSALQITMLGSFTGGMSVHLNNLERMGQQMQGGDMAKELMEATQRGDTEKMNELSQKMSESSAAAMKESMNVMGAMAGAFPMIILAAIVMYVISSLGVAYFTVFGLFPNDSVQSIVSKVVTNLIPMIFLWIWLVIRSFIWIPIIGIIPAIIIGPRLVLAPTILLTEGKGVMESASESYKRTHGQWVTIFVNMLLCGLIMGISIVILRSVLYAILSSTLPGVFLVEFVQQAGHGAMVVFSVALSLALMGKNRA